MVVAQQRFPEDIYQQLDGVDFRLIDELTFLSKLQRERTGASYCIPGRKYLARKLRVCVRTVSRHIAKLRKLGVLDTVQRRPVLGQFQTNLYKVFEWTVWKARRVISMVRHVAKAMKPKTGASGVASFSLPNRGTYVSYIAHKNERITPPDSFFFHSNPIIRCWMARG